MGSGKSSVGPALARRLGRPFVDNDRRIEEAAGLAIPEIFAREGEAGFRTRESRAIEEVAGCGAVVALGGGAIAQPGAPERLAKLGTVVYLRAGVDVLLSRIGEAGDRPLLAGRDREARRRRLVELLAAREAAYRTAEIVVETGGRSVEEVAGEIERVLRRAGDARR